MQRAYLYLVRDVDVGEPPYELDELRQMAFDPDDVTRLVGLEPTRAWQRGDPHPYAPLPRRFSRWAFELAEVRTYVTEEVVSQLLDAIEPYAAGIADACSTLGMRAGVAVVITMSGGRDTVAGGLHVSTASITYIARTLQRLAGLGLSVDHDQYVLLPD
ncbi:DUF4279 domain-containing protein [Couchioplanes azureus]|uniref:DUF4279 domain-containing protein n=1 Tax=Couchioplanes caeruleus TaxID=56438 RepID=UPI001670A2D9|nr:DUF4279 domain-containing protein [Couchioplanes caeruleus]